MLAFLSPFMEILQNSRHPHGKAFYYKMGVEWLENILREEAVVDARIFVLL